MDSKDKVPCSLETMAIHESPRDFPSFLWKEWKGREPKQPKQTTSFRVMDLQWLNISFCVLNKRKICCFLQSMSLDVVLNAGNSWVVDHSSWVWSGWSGLSNENPIYIYIFTLPNTNVPFAPWKIGRAYPKRTPNRFPSIGWIFQDSSCKKKA